MPRKPLWIVLIFLLTSSLVLAKGKRVVFEGRVVRIESKGPIKISCGVAIVYRLAEYQVERVDAGRIPQSQDVVVRHLACNGNELDDLQAGDRVIVTASRVPKPERRVWLSKPFGENKENVTVTYYADKVAKIVYPTSR